MLLIGYKAQRYYIDSNRLNLRALGCAIHMYTFGESVLTLFQLSVLPLITTHAPDFRKKRLGTPVIGDGIVLFNNIMAYSSSRMT